MLHYYACLQVPDTAKGFLHPTPQPDHHRPAREPAPQQHKVLSHAPRSVLHHCHSVPSPTSQVLPEWDLALARSARGPHLSAEHSPSLHALLANTRQHEGSPAPAPSVLLI